MSYRKGFEAFLARIQRQFPVDKFDWMTQIPMVVDGVYDLVQVDGIHLPEDKDYVDYRIGDPGRVYRVFDRTDVMVLTIRVNLQFGIRLEVTSQFWTRRTPLDPDDSSVLKNGVPVYRQRYYVYRRPLTLCFQNTHGKRGWLRHKPKFARDGARVASFIKRGYLDSAAWFLANAERLPASPHKRPRKVKEQ